MDSQQLEEVLRRVEESLDDKDAALIRAVFQSYVYVSDPGGRQEHLDSPAAPAVLRGAHRKDRRRGRAQNREAGGGFTERRRGRSRVDSRAAGQS